MGQSALHWNTNEASSGQQVGRQFAVLAILTVLDQPNLWEMVGRSGHTQRAHISEHDSLSYSLSKILFQHENEYKYFVARPCVLKSRGEICRVGSLKLRWNSSLGVYRDSQQ